jgi:outer membrane autotransporter protein
MTQQAALVGVFILFFIFSTSQTALSACSPTPTTGPDTINCTGPSANAALSTLAGSDVINYNSGAGSTIDAGADNDTINLTGGTLSGGVNGGNGADTFNLNGTAVTGNLDGGNGDAAIDKFFLNSGSAANVSGQGGNDEIYLQGATIGNSTAGIINAGDGNDIITVTSGTVFGIQGWLGSDTITVSGASTIVHAYVNGTWGNDFYYLNGGTINRIEEFDGDDYIELNGATINNFIVGLSGSDIIKLKSGSVGGNVHGDDGDDTIDLEGASVTGTILGANNSDTINLKSGSAGGVDGGAGIDFITQTGGSVVSIVGGTENDEIKLNGGNVTSTGNAVTGGDGDDLIELNGSTVAGAILGQGGSDTINLKSGSAGNVDGGAGIDFITQTGGSVVSIAGGTENDEIKLSGGNVTSTGNAVAGGDGNDLLELNGSTVTGAFQGDAGSDTINLKSGSAGAVDGGAGIDFITQTGGSVLSIAGGTENDEIKLNGGNVTSTGNAVAGGDGDDLLELNGSTVAGAILGEGGNDTINWTLGSLLSINGGNGSDTVIVSASAYDGSQRLDGGDDTLTGDGFIDDLTIAGRTFSTSGDSLSNWEEITLSGGGLTLSDGALRVGDPSDEMTGLFLTGGAHLRSNGPLALIGNLSIGAGSHLEQLSGDMHSISGRLANSGTIDLQDGATGDALLVGGDYSGGGHILLDLDANAALSDRMEIGGSVIGAATRLVVSEVSGLEGSGTPIGVVTVGGQTSAGDFVAENFMAGAYLYSLELDGQEWAFRPTLTSGGSFYPTVGGMLAGFARESVATHYRRSGQWGRARAAGDEQVFGATSVLAAPDTAMAGDVNFWLRGIGAWTEGEGTLSGGAGEQISYDRDSRGLQGGLDFVLAEGADFLLTGGVFAQFGKITGNSKDAVSGSTTGSADTSAIGLGSAIAIEADAFYGEIAAGWNEYGIDTVLSDGASGETDGQGYFVSIEGGRIVRLSGSMALIPQAQLAWIGTDIDSFTDSSGTEIAYESDDIALGRLGVALDVFSGTLGGQPLRFAGIVNYWQQFGETAQALVGGAPLSLEQAGGSIEAGAGFHWGQPNAPLHLHGELTYRETFNGLGEQAWNATIGARLAF